MRIRCFLLIMSLFLCALEAQGQQLALQNLDKMEFKDVVGELSTNFLHTSVMGAETLGDIFGFEFGVVGGVTRTPNIDAIVHAVDNTAEAKQVPHAELLGVVTVPMAVTLEAGLVPKVGSNDFKFNELGLAAKWTPTDLFTDWPFHLAAKLHYSKANIEFGQSINNAGTTHYDYENSVMGLTFLASQNFAIVEPYVGLGYVKSKGDLSATGTSASSVFVPSYTASTSASESISGTMFVVGAELKLVVLKLGAEYTRLYDTNRFTGKLSFYF